MKLARFVSLLVLAIIVLSACGSKKSDQKPTSSDSDSMNMSMTSAEMPDYVRNAPPRVREAYEYAVANPDELTNYPCYCGCGNMGHTSNQSCFVDNIAPDGTVTYDNHAAGCGICVDIAQDAMHLRAEGKSRPEIRAYIDATYGSYGPSTNTSLPVE
jgi:hypothetical protein